MTTAKKIGAYELVPLGFEHGDYKRPYELALNEFTYATVATGDSPQTALREAIEQVAARGWDTSDLELELAKTPDYPTQFSEYGDEADAPYYWFGIRWHS